jgi:trans-aconitate methyltransferase
VIDGEHGPRSILSRIESGVARYYGDKVTAHGATPKGVDWNTLESQQLRFRQLLRVAEDAGAFSLTDWGCGYGALLEFLHGDDRLRRYQGYDIAAPMLAAARQRHGARSGCDFVADLRRLQSSDFVVASGVFNVRLDVATAEWQDHVLANLQCMAGLATRGFAFNMLTSHADREHQRADLFYAEPAWWFDHCKRHLAPRVALLHDYPLWEFTILCRK